MNNRVTPYERGWLTLLVNQGICTEAEARDAQNRVAQEAVEELHRRRRAAREEKRRRKREEG